MGDQRCWGTDVLINHFQNNINYVNLIQIEAAMNCFYSTNSQQRNTRQYRMHCDRSWGQSTSVPGWQEVARRQGSVLFYVMVLTYKAIVPRFPAARIQFCVIVFHRCVTSRAIVSSAWLTRCLATTAGLTPSHSRTSVGMGDPFFCETLLWVGLTVFVLSSLPVIPLFNM